MGVGGASACTACPGASLSGTDPRAASRSPVGRFRIPLSGDTSISARFEGADPQAGRQWLRDTFTQINNGRHADFSLPGRIVLTVPSQTKVVVSGIDKQQVGEVAANIRKLRKPEPYKGKGIRYEGEVVRRKVGKAGK